MPKAIAVRVTNRTIAREYRRACQLLNTTQSAVLYRCVISTIRRAKEQFPHSWGLLSDYDSLIIESIEEHNTELGDIVRYTRLKKEQVTALLADLIERDLVRVTEIAGDEAHPGRGTLRKTYSLGKRAMPTAAKLPPTKASTSRK